jgi:hypothetical protein
MAFAEDQDVIQALAPDCANQALNIWIAFLVVGTAPNYLVRDLCLPTLCFGSRYD